MTRVTVRTGAAPGKHIDGHRCARRTAPHLVSWCPARPRAMRSSPANPSRSFGRAAAVFDLITSSTSGQLDRDTADRLRPRAAARGPLVAVREAPPGRTSHRGRVGMRISGNRAVQEQVLSCRCSFLGHAEQPTPSHRREHVSAASAQVNGVIVASAVGKVDGNPLADDRLQLVEIEERSVDIPVPMASGAWRDVGIPPVSHSDGGRFVS